MIGLQSLGEHLGDILHGIKPIGGVKDDGVNCAIEKLDLSVETSLEGYEIEEPVFPIMVTGVFGDNAFYNVRPTEQLLEDSNNEYLICLAKLSRASRIASSSWTAQPYFRRVTMTTMVLFYQVMKKMVGPTILKMITITTNI